MQDQKKQPDYISNLNSKPASKSKSMDQKNERNQIKQELN